jgi:hypothetical protein
MPRRPCRTRMRNPAREDDDGMPPLDYD